MRIDALVFLAGAIAGAVLGLVRVRSDRMSRRVLATCAGALLGTLVAGSILIVVRAGFAHTEVNPAGYGQP